MLSAGALKALAVLTFLLAVAPPVVAHPLTPPKPVHEVPAQWPEGRAHDHDLIIPVVLVVGIDGSVLSARVDAGIGEPFDAAAVRAALMFRFEPARDDQGRPHAAKVRALIRFLGVEAVEEAPPTAPEPRRAKPSSAPGAAPEPGVVAEVVVRGEAVARSASETRRTGRVLHATPHQTASDLLTTVPGVFVTQHSGQGKAHQIFFRGFDAVHGQDIEIWAGGAPVNEVSHVHGQGYADLHFIMPEVVRSVRAQPGAYDPRQGDFAIAGSMELELGYDQPGLTVKTSLGSFGTRRAFIAYHPLESSERTFGAAELQKTDGFGENRRAERASGIAGLDLELGAGLSLTLLASAYASRFASAGVLRVSDIESGAIGRFESYDSEQGGRGERVQLAATLRRTSASSELVFAPFVVRRSLVLRSNYTGFLHDPINGDLTQQRHDVTTIGVRASYRRSLRLLSSRDAVEAGISVRSDSADQSQHRLRATDGSVSATELDGTVQALTIGTYLDAEVRPVRRLAIRGGVRADGLSFRVVDRQQSDVARSAQGTRVGLKGTAEVVLLPGLNATASYGEGFRSPQARSLADGERAPFAEARSQELGLRLRRGGLSAALAAYRTTLSDDVVFDEATGRNERAPGTLRLGAVADLVAEPTAWFTSALGFTYTRATFTETGGRYVEGRLVPFVPQVITRADVAVELPVRRIGSRELVARAGAAATYLYRRPIPFGELGSDVMLVDLKLGATFGEIALDLDVTNVLDRSWYDGEFVSPSSFTPGQVASALPVRHVTAGAPRSLLLSLTLHI